MKKLIQICAAILISPLFLTGQNTTSLPSYQHAIELNVPGLFEKELNFQYEKVLNNKSSLVAGIGYKRHNNPEGLAAGTQSNNYVERHEERLSWIILIPLPSENTTYVGGSGPLPEYGAFVPTFSIPARLNYRYYFAKNQTPFRFFVEPGIHGNYHAGLAIRDQFTTNKVRQWSEIEGIPILVGSSSQITESSITQNRTMTADSKFLFGTNLALGFQWRFSPNVGIAATTEIGNNFSGSEQWSNYTIGQSYLRWTASMCFVF